MCDQSALNFKDGRDGELKAFGFREGLSKCQFL